MARLPASPSAPRLVEWTVEPRGAAELSTRWSGEEVWALATRQHGIVERDQLLRLGVSRHVIRRWVCDGHLRPVHRGVYMVGHGRLTHTGWWMAAVLACGEGAALSHRCGAHHRGLISWRPARPSVSVPQARRSRPPGIAVHRIQRVEPVLVDAIPCTPVARIIIDMAAISGRRTLEKLVENAVIQGVFDLRELHATLSTIARPRGVRLLRSVLAEIKPGTTYTRSDLEEATLALCRRAGVPDPLCNQPIQLLDGSFCEADFAWPGPRVVVETDSNRYHATHYKRRKDREKDRALQLAGWMVLRVPEDDLVERSQAILADLRTALARRVDS